MATSKQVESATDSDFHSSRAGYNRHTNSTSFVCRPRAHPRQRLHRRRETSSSSSLLPSQPSPPTLSQASSSLPLSSHSQASVQFRPTLRPSISSPPRQMVKQEITHLALLSSPLLSSPLLSSPRLTTSLENNARKRTFLAMLRRAVSCAYSRNTDILASMRHSQQVCPAEAFRQWSCTVPPSKWTRSGLRL